MSFLGKIMAMAGWKFVGDLDGLSRSVVVVAPHTSYWDAVVGKAFLVSHGLKHRFLSARWLFFFPMNIFMKMFGSIPVGGRDGGNAIHEACKLLTDNDEMHLVICPEGGFAPKDKWNPGFYFIAVKAQVPIVTAYIDYKKKEVGIKSIIRDIEDQNQVFKQIIEDYKDVTARHPENFKLPTKNVRK